MSDVIKVSALLLGSALLMFAGGLQGLLYPIRGGQEGFSLAVLGLIGAGWSAGFIAGTLTVPWVVRRVGYIRSFSVMAAVASIAILVSALLVEQFAWVALRAVSGFCFAGAAMIVESWINEVTQNERRGMVFGAYSMSTLVFITAGQLTLYVMDPASFMPFVIAGMVFSLAVLPTALSVSPQPQPLVRARFDLGHLYRTSPVSVAATLGVGLANGAFGTLAPVYGIQSGFSSAIIVVLMSLAIVTGALGQFPFGRWSDLTDRRRVIVVVSLIAAIAGMALVAVDPGEGWTLYALFGFFGLAAFSLYPVAVAHANDHVDDGDFARVAAGLLLLYGVGLAIGPIVGSAAMSLLRPVDLFLFTATVHALVAGVALWRMRVAPPAADRSPFQAMPWGRGTTQAVALDPRIEDADDPSIWEPPARDEDDQPPSPPADAENGDPPAERSGG